MQHIVPCQAAVRPLIKGPLVTHRPARGIVEAVASCGTCNGQGGWWEYGNGQPGKAKPKQWIKCHDCSGKGDK